MPSPSALRTSDGFPKSSAQGRRLHDPKVDVDISLLVERADARVAAWRDQWSALEGAVGQLATLLNSEESRTLFEAASRLWEALGGYERAAPSQKASADSEELATLERSIQEAARAEYACAMVQECLTRGWELLETLDAIFQSRVGDSEAAKRHIASREFDDWRTKLATGAGQVEAALQRLNQRTEQTRHQADQLAEMDGLAKAQSPSGASAASKPGDQDAG